MNYIVKKDSGWGWLVVQEHGVQREWTFLTRRGARRWARRRVRRENTKTERIS